MRLRRITVGALALTLGVALGAVGCGGGDSSTSQSQTPSGFASQADKVCRETQALAQNALKTAVADYRHHRATRQQAIGRLQVAASSAERRAMTELSALDAPSAKEATFKQYLAARRQAVALEPKIGSSQAASDANGKKREAVQKKRAKLARELGFKSCS